MQETTHVVTENERLINRIKELEEELLISRSVNEQLVLNPLKGTWPIKYVDEEVYGKYFYSTDEEFYYGSPCENPEQSKIESIEEGYVHCPDDTIYIGKSTKPPLPETQIGAAVIDSLEDFMFDNWGEWAEDWFSKMENDEELKSLLNRVCLSIVTHKYPIQHYSVEDVESFSVTLEELEEHGYEQE